MVFNLNVALLTGKCELVNSFLCTIYMYFQQYSNILMYPHTINSLFLNKKTTIITGTGQIKKKTYICRINLSMYSISL